jgi:hypothetical protein
MRAGSKSAAATIAAGTMGLFLAGTARGEYVESITLQPAVLNVSMPGGFMFHLGNPVGVHQSAIMYGEFHVPVIDGAVAIIQQTERLNFYAGGVAWRSGDEPVYSGAVETGFTTTMPSSLTVVRDTGSTQASLQPDASGVTHFALYNDEQPFLDYTDEGPYEFEALDANNNLVGQNYVKVPFDVRSRALIHNFSSPAGFGAMAVLQSPVLTIEYRMDSNPGVDLFPFFDEDAPVTLPPLNFLNFGASLDSMPASVTSTLPPEVAALLPEPAALALLALAVPLATRRRR